MADEPNDTFYACSLPWRIWTWGLSLVHSDTDVSPECSVEFGTNVARRIKSAHESYWAKVEFQGAAFASAKPHRDDETLETVTGYDIVPRSTRSDLPMLDALEAEEAEWIRTGVCPDPWFYYSTDSAWLRSERGAWAHRQRGPYGPEDAVHFLLDGRDGYIEILATGFSWRAWTQGHPRLNAVSGEPIMSGEWTLHDNGPP
jgi:hypothetical protein